jgi:long-chain acyl-CoA synthetase
MLTPLAAFLTAVQQQPNQTYLRQPRNGVYQDYSWAKVAELARNMAFQLRKLGVTPGDKVALWSKNCAEWVISDLAIMMAGAVSVPLYPGQSKANVHYVLEHSEAKIMFVGKHDDDNHVMNAIPENFPTIAFNFYSGSSHYLWDTLVAQPVPDDFSIHQPKLDEMMTLVYTSGTTGQPKGAIHTHGSYAFATNNGVESIGLGSQDRVISFLPLAHVAERVIILGTSYYSWHTIWFAESLDTFGDNLAATSPTLFFAVPRLWSKFQEGILAKVGGQKKLSRLLSIPILGSIVKRKIQKGLGLHECKLAGCGASPMPKALIEWFDTVGITIVEGYGMTENMCYGTFNFPNDRKVGSVGKPFRQNEVKISEEGEILFKSKALMKGYYKEPEKTAEALVDGYYHTGDKGMIDEDGFLHITGRVKELFKTSKGKYIAPAPLEALLASHVHIEQACVMGSGRNQPLAVIELSETARAMDKGQVEQEITEHLGKVNRQVEHHERIDCIVVTQLMWTVETDLITPTLKIRRDTVEGRYLELAREDQLVVWGPKEVNQAAAEVAA